MTRSLFLLRHGKSDWNAPYGGDHERPLKRRGQKASKRMGRLLTESGNAPDRILSSSAVRARSTAEAAHAAGSWRAAVEIVPELYGASAAGILELVRGLGPEVERVLVVGHEPTCSETVALFTDSRPPVYPTAALARIDLVLASWSDVAPGAGTLAWLIPPRALDGPH